ncbi:hypothetical protein GCM10023310_01330 [Paenibacillus vulneris]
MEDTGKLSDVKMCRSHGKKVLLLRTYHANRYHKRTRRNDRKDSEATAKRLATKSTVKHLGIDSNGFARQVMFPL